MTDFFTALEAELHTAATRRPRPWVDAGQVLAVVAALVLVATAALLVSAISTGGDGQSGRSTREQQLPEPRPEPLPSDRKSPPPRPGRVVARGKAAGVGPWKIGVSRTPGERDTNGRPMWRRGWCVWLTLLRHSDGVVPASSGFCGSPRNLGFPRTPGFSRFQTLVPDRRPGRVVLVWGRVPHRAAQVAISAPGRARMAIAPSDGLKGFPGRFYVIPVRTRLPGAQINWIDADGRPVGPGIRLLPPITR